MTRTTGTDSATWFEAVAPIERKRQRTQSAGCTRGHFADPVASACGAASRLTDTTSARASATDAKVGSTSWIRAARSQPKRLKRECSTETG